MKKSLLLLVLVTGYCFICSAQTKAVTDVGDEVLLYPNGTWKYADGRARTSSTADSVVLNHTTFTKNKLATFLVKSTRTANVGVYLNPAEWVFEKGNPTEAIEYRFKYKAATDLYVFAITEKIEVPLENLPDVVLANAQKKVSDVEIVKKEFRMVNGKKILCMEYHGTSTGIKFVWMGYYYSSPAGTVQLVAATSENLFQDNYKIFENFLNGLVVL
jgi:hypothetical protein